MSLVKDAYVYYDEHFINLVEADTYFNIFNTFDFKYDTYNSTKLMRQTCAFVDKSTIDKTDKIPKIWGDKIVIKEFTPELLQIKTLIEKKIKELTGKDWNYNIILCNRYLSGKDVINFHSDKEEYGDTKSIASISLGVKRTFTYRNKTIDELVPVVLNHGSLIFMGDNCQERYIHGMKKEDLNLINSDNDVNKYNGTRINLTFRIFDY